MLTVSVEIGELPQLTEGLGATGERKPFTFQHLLGTFRCHVQCQVLKAFTHPFRMDGSVAVARDESKKTPQRGYA